VGPRRRWASPSSLAHASDESYSRAYLPRSTGSNDPYYHYHPERQAVQVCLRAPPDMTLSSGASAPAPSLIGLAPAHKRPV